MGLKLTCDCCQEPCDSAKQVGFIDKRYYCEKCEVFYEEYLKELDDYHTEIAELAAERLGKIRNKWLKHHKGAELPDGR